MPKVNSDCHRITSILLLLCDLIEDGNLFITLHAESAILWETDTASEVQRFPLGLPPESSLRDRVKVTFNADSDGILFFVQLDNNLAGLTSFQLNGADVNRYTFVDVVHGEINVMTGDVSVA